MQFDKVDVQGAARRLRESLHKTGVEIGLGRSLELVAAQLGFRDWNTLAATLGKTAVGNGTELGGNVPVLRSFDESATRAFYVDYLGYDVEWEHRFEPGIPLYMRLRRSGSVLDLSEHHGDGTPGSVVWIPVRDARVFQRELKNTGHHTARPGVDRDAPGGPTVTVIDPASNILRFCQPEYPDEHFI